MTPIKTDHEEILIFLEENISKLVKQKVASRAKYKQYDEAYMNYLTADSIDDEDRKEMYGEEVELCYQQMLNKLLKALIADKSLMDIEVVKKFHDVMLPELSDERIPDDDEIIYTDLFKGCGDETEDLVETLLCLSPGTPEESEDKLDDLPEEALIMMLKNQFYNKVETWIDDLPHNDLKLLRELSKKGGRMEAPYTPQDLLVEELVMVDRSLGNEETPSEYILYPDVQNTLEPYLDEAIRKKEENDEGFLECLFMGIMNMVGVIDETDAKDAIKSFVRQAGRKLTEKDVEHFFDHSMLVRFHRGAYTCSPGGLLGSRLSDACWEDEVREELDTCMPTDMLDVIAHGQYPYFVAHRKEERAFWNLLRKQMDDEDASSLLTHYYYKLQDPEYSMKDMVNEFSEDFTFESLKDANNAMAILTDFSNSIPKFILQGHSSKDVARTTAPQSKQFLDRMRDFSHSTFTEPFVNTNKVGRNDPCPCGSGLKYKKCCGK